MKAIVADRFGGPELLQLRDVPAPHAKANEALIRVAVAGVNFGDTVVRSGAAGLQIDLPWIPGSEVAGVVESVGDSVTNVAPGDRVLAPLFLSGRLGGAYAEQAVLDAGLLVRIPDSISFEQAIACSLQGLTVWLMMRQVPVRDRTVLIHAAAGGVGSLLLQLVKRQRAAKVIATAGDADKLALARRLGADVVANYRESDWHQRVRDVLASGPDVIFDSVGGEIRRHSLALLAPLGTMVLYGGSSGGGYTSDGLEAGQVGNLMVNNQSVIGFSMWPLLGDRTRVERILVECFAELFALVDSGSLDIVVGARWPLAEASEAHRALESRQTVGKVVLTISRD